MGAAKQSFAWACAGRKSIQMTVLARVYRKADAARLRKGLNGRRAAPEQASHPPSFSTNLARTKSGQSKPSVKRA